MKFRKMAWWTYMQDRKGDIDQIVYLPWTSLVAQTVKHLTTTWETQVQSLGWEDLLEKETATHSSILAWKIPWTKETGRLQSMGLQRITHDWVASLSRASQVALVIKNLPANCRRLKRCRFDPWVGKILWRIAW